MRLIKKSIECVGCVVKHTPGKVQAIVNEFVESDMECAEIVDHDCKNAWIAAGCVNKTIQSLKVKGVRAASRHGHCYIFRVKENKK